MRYSIPLLLLFLLGLFLTGFSGQPATPSTAPKVRPVDTQAVFAYYVGQWQVHDALLTIHANRTGLYQWSVGPCTQSMTETRMCSGSATITFTLNADGSIKGKFKSVWYTQWDGKPSPAGFQTDSEDPRAGDTFELQHRKGHLLYTTWFGHLSTLNNYNRYWCDPYALHHGWYECGA